MLKDAHWWSNYFDGIPQIIQEYSGEQNFIVRQLEMETWAMEHKCVPQRLKDVCGRLKHKIVQLIVPKGTKVHITLRENHSIKEVLHLYHLQMSV